MAPTATKKNGGFLQCNQAGHPEKSKLVPTGRIQIAWLQREQQGVSFMVIVRQSDTCKNILLRHLSGILVKYTCGISALVHCYKLNVFLTFYHDISVQYEPTGYTIYFQFLSVINLYMFRAGLLLIIRRYYVDWPLAGSCQQPVNINARL